jgi:type II secretion system protein G
MQKKGFTLIELLIVVAIIAILAAIAVPNFLEAQVRAKVSRVKSDHRSLATAIESYYVDHGTYPPNHNGPAQGVQQSMAGVNPRSFIVMTVLSTPIAYIANSLLPDPFPSRYSVNGSGGDIYTYTSASRDDTLATIVIQDLLVDGNPANSSYPTLATFFSGSSFDGTLIQAQGDQLFSLGWALYSQGPDRVSRLQEIAIENAGDPKNVAPSDFVQWLGETAATAPAIYDPTNGTVSRGDILRTTKGPFEPRHVGL